MLIMSFDGLIRLLHHGQRRLKKAGVTDIEKRNGMQKSTISRSTFKPPSTEAELLLRAVIYGHTTT